MNNPKRAAAYPRVSTEDQAENGYSLLDQTNRCRAMALAKGWVMVEEDYTEDGVSGTLRHRPKLDNLLSDVKSGKIDVVIVTKMDRLARSLKLLLELWDLIESYGATVVVIEESIDTSTSVGRLIRNVLGSIAEFERDTIMARTMGGKRAKVARGEVLRSTPAYGYTYILRDGKNVGYLEIDPAAEPTVRRIFELVTTGMSTIKVAELLTREEVPTPKGGKAWAFSTIRTIITNATYKGQAPHGQQVVVRRDKDTGKQVRRRGPAKDHAACPAIVSPELWDAANAQLVRNRKQSRRNAKNDYLLGGELLKCGICGRTMTGMRRRSSMYYRCSHVDHEGHRVMHSVNGKDAEAAVWGALCRLLRDHDQMVGALDRLANKASEESRDLEGQITSLERSVVTAKEQGDRLLDLYLSGGITKERYEVKAADLEDKAQRMQDKIADLSGRRDAARQQLIPVEQIKAWCDHYGPRLDAMTFAEKRAVLTTLVTSLVAYPDHVVVDGDLANDPIIVPIVSEPCRRSASNLPLPFTLHVPLKRTSLRRHKAVPQRRLVENTIDPRQSV